MRVNLWGFHLKKYKQNICFQLKYEGQRNMQQ